MDLTGGGGWGGEARIADLGRSRLGTTVEPGGGGAGGGTELMGARGGAAGAGKGRGAGGGDGGRGRGGDGGRGRGGMVDFSCLSGELNPKRPDCCCCCCCCCCGSRMQRLFINTCDAVSSV